MYIRRAKETDMPGINNLLRQVLMVHHNGRPDLFKANAKKYTDEELKDILKDDTRPIFVGVDEEENVMGYAFCVFQQHIGNNILTDVKTLYIDDLCVDESCRGQGIATKLYRHAVDYARFQGCKFVSLNVWSGNDALQFYEKMGMRPRSMTMETPLQALYAD